MKSQAPKFNRKLHRFGSILTAAPLLVIILSGILLQLKKDWSWVQPPTLRGSTQGVDVDWDVLVAAAVSAEEAGVQGWGDIERMDVRPSKGMVKIQAKSGWEVQVDAATGAVLQTRYRRSDLIESIHDGTFFGGPIKLWVFLPTAVILLGLWFTGLYLWVLPYLVRRRRSAS